MTDQSDYLFREVDEELRRDQLKKLWEKYGTYMLAAVALIVVGVGLNQWWQARRVAAAEAAGAQFQQAIDLASEAKLDDARKAYESIAAARRTPYATLAQLSLAGAAVKAGKNDEALAGYEVVAKDASDPIVRDFARVQAAALKVDTADFTEVQNRLNDLIGDKSPWRYVARELWGISAMRAGKLNEARQMLAPLSADPRAPQEIRERASAEMALVVEAEQEKTAPAKVEIEKTDPPAGPPAKGDTSAGSAAKGAKAGGAKR